MQVMSSTPQQPKLYASHLSVPYTTSSSPLLTLDVHTPTTPPSLSSSSFALIYIHGGAFRDPLITSLSLLPSLSSIFSPPGPGPAGKGKGISIAVVASLNYRLSAYPAHPSQPVGGDEENRNVIWPTHLDDVLKAIHFLFSSSSSSSPSSPFSSSFPLSSSSSTSSTTTTTAGGKKEEGGGGGGGGGEEEEEGGIILCGHSVGGTLAVHAAAALLSIKDAAASGSGVEGNNNNNKNSIIPPVCAVVSLAGIFNFRKCRDAHRSFGRLYDDFMTAAFGGPEEMGTWAVADLYPSESDHDDDGDGKRLTRQGESGGSGGVGGPVPEILKRNGRGLVLVLGYSKEDELVEGEQGEGFASVLRQDRGQTDDEEGRLKVRHVECKGGHHEIVDQGVEIGRCVRVAVDMLLGEVW